MREERYLNPSTEIPKLNSNGYYDLCCDLEHLIFLPRQNPVVAFCNSAKLHISAKSHAYSFCRNLCQHYIKYGEDDLVAISAFDKALNESTLV